jgi:hypothetical protein
MNRSILSLVYARIELSAIDSQLIPVCYPFDNFPLLVGA